MISAFLDTAEVVSGLLHSPVLAERWERPSALAALGVSSLAGHLARAVFNVERWVAESTSTTWRSAWRYPHLRCPPGPPTRSPPA
ncbi:hypothetical protein [Microbispora rosea]|uniref:hypothetical protein n=1 Tax=Microbispora rosea TaxID=58117 RepID=UPI0034454256